MSTASANYLYNQSCACLEGKQTPKDLPESFRLNAEAADLGHREAILAMGWYFLNGFGVAKNLAKAQKWYRKSARHGEPKAMFSLGTIAYDDHDFSESMVWFKRAVENGHARSLFWIGKHHWRGQGVPQDRKEALRFFHLSANQGDASAKRTVKFLSRRR